MKSFFNLFHLLFLIFSLNGINGDLYYNSVDDVFEYFEGQFLEDSDYQEIIDNLLKIFADSYAFYDISKNPPQPLPNYHSIVDIQKNLKEINVENLNAYEFYRRLSNVLSSLKDSHIRIFMNDFDFEEFFILGPFYYSVKEFNGEQRLFAKCLDDEDIIAEFEVEDEVDLLELCYHIDEIPIKTINDKDPFEYINNFGGEFLATKNPHGTFSNKMNFHNYVSLNDMPLTQEELNNLIVVFDNEEETTIKTKFIFETTVDITAQENFLRSLRSGRGFYTRDIYNSKKENHNKYLNIKEKRKNNRKKNFEKKNKLRELSTVVNWDFNLDDIFRCYSDDENKINVYYINTFDYSDRQKYIETMIKCVNLFDNNQYPILVINELNNGGYISLSQLFMGILSPLMPINLFKGRIRITEAFQKNEDLLYYISSNLTNINDCKNASYDDLLEEKVKTNYSETFLTKAFYITNVTIHNKIEEIRGKMKNKRKPTEILVLTDGYSFSAAGLYIKYLQKMGGAIVAGYYGNPNSNFIFDSGQSPSGLFTSDILSIFNKKENVYLQNTYNIRLEFPGVQTFYELDEKNTPLEYEITPVDLRINIFQEFNDDTYFLFIKESLSIFNNANKCYPNNVLKFSDDCHFENDYTHGGYACNKNDGTWSNTCVKAYCNLGYSFDNKKNKCVKDICTSLPIPDEKEEEKEEEKKEEEKDDDDDEGKKDSNTTTYIVLFTICGIIILFIVIFVVIHCSKKKLYSSSIDFSK